MGEIEVFSARFKQIEKLFVNSEIFKQSEASFTSGLKKFAVTEQEKAVAYADFKSKTLTALIGGACDAALRLGVAYEQEISEKEQREAQVSQVEEGVLKTRIDQEVGLASLALTKMQSRNEALRKADLQAGVRIKEAQLLGVYIANVAENEKRDVLIKSANDNAVIKRGEHLNNYLKVLSDDKDFNIINEKLHETVKKNLLDIGMKELTAKKIDVPRFEPINVDFNELDKSADAKPVFRIITKRDIKKGEPTSLYCLAAGIDLSRVIFAWTIEGQTYATQKVRHVFSAGGKTEITCEISVGSEKYTQKESLYVD